MNAHPSSRRFTAPVLVILFGCLTLGCVESPEPNPPQVVAAKLVPLLKDRDPELRRTAALSLGKIAAPGVVAALREGLKDPDEEVRRNCAWALGNLGEAVIDDAGLALVQALNDPAASVKAAAAEAIGNIGGTQAMVEMLSEALEEPDVATRRTAVLALGWLEAPSSYEALVEALHDPDAGVRQGAVAALGELADVQVLPLLRERLLRDPHPGVRSEAAFRLGKIGDESVLPVLRLISQKDESLEVRRWAAWAATFISQ